MTNFAHGRTAEEAAANYLVRLGYEIIDQNWRRRSCEIDIVARKGEVIYFVEVKYRQNNKQGSGLEYITPAKLKQMTFAATMWVAENNWNADYNLAAIEVAGQEYEITEFIDSVS